MQHFILHTATTQRRDAQEAAVCVPTAQLRGAAQQHRFELLLYSKETQHMFMEPGSIGEH